MSTVLQGGILCRKRKSRALPDARNKAPNTDHLQSKLIERTGKVQPDRDNWSTDKAYDDIERGAEYFWSRNGRVRPPPAQAWDPFLSNAANANRELRALKKVTT